MKIKIVIIICMFLTSCSTTYYQVYKINAEGGKIEYNKILFEDENVSISYNFWENGGDAGFLFMNKTNNDITVHLNKSFFVINGIAYDYYKSRTFSKSTNVSAITGYKTLPNTSYYKLYADFYSSLNATSFVEKETVFIPSSTSKRIAEYAITNNLFNSCDMRPFPTRRKVEPMTFDQNSTPHIFSNIITYSTTNDTNRIENKFFVSSITNMPETEVFETRKETVCGVETVNLVKVAKLYGPDMFYIKYSKKRK